MTAVCDTVYLDIVNLDIVNLVIVNLVIVNLDMVMGLGADRVIDYTATDFTMDDHRNLSLRPGDGLTTHDAPEQAHLAQLEC